ncbi:siroheme synthase [Mycena alexandri]|uniref:precorrin-2 dehydrogenase n=1 Tax=Mycena alexandri TaxID=1745969 RepID=A0AAD6TN92_9AGAR|nr:siroheme synthase [Mycena alexandri]
MADSCASDAAPPPSIGGGSLLIAWQLKDKNVLIVGGGEVASQRIESILTADALITLLAPAKGVHARTKELIDTYPSRITYYDRRFSGPAEIHKMDMVLTALDDVNRSREICDMCRQAKVPVNAADIPELCDFYFGAQIRDGPLQIMISTNGNGPRMAALMKKKIQSALSGREGEAIERVGVLRAQLKERVPGVGGALGRKRMKWMSEVCNTWEVDELMQLDDAIIKKLLDEGWEKDCVPTLAQLKGQRKRNTSRRAGSAIAPADSSQWLPMIGSFALGATCTMLIVLARKK